MADKFGEGAGEGGRPKNLKEFLFRGNVLDLAVAVIIGAAFGRVVSSLVSDIIMPPIGLLLGGVDFTSLFINLSGQTYPTIAAAKAAGAPTINYGTFFNTVIDFILVGTILFLIVRSATRVTPQAKAPTPQVTTKVCPYCVSSVPLAATRCPYCTSELAQ
ncbi:MAG: large conductance mechanosensitive channel protein MscL [Chloroflexota bacterium]|nr:large conductance mechanosensitive channel protein MscL [Chloroflexota bacterium]